MPTNHCRLFNMEAQPPLLGKAVTMGSTQAQGSAGTSRGWSVEEDGLGTYCSKAVAPAGGRGPGPSHLHLAQRSHGPKKLTWPWSRSQWKANMVSVIRGAKKCGPGGQKCGPRDKSTTRTGGQSLANPLFLRKGGWGAGAVAVAVISAGGSQGKHPFWGGWGGRTWASS